MIRELFLKDLSLWACVWQSTSFALIGLVGSYLLRRRPARASQMLLLGMIAAVTVPAMGVMVKQFELGIFMAKPVKIEATMPNEFVPTVHEVSTTVPASIEIANEAHVEVGQAILTEADSESVDILWRLTVLYGWMGASLVLLGRVLASVVGGVCLLRRAQPTGREQIKRAVDCARSRLAVTGNLRVRSSGSVSSPVIWCWSRQPVLIVPNDADHDFDWIGVICHELAHCMRKDHLTGLIAELVVCILPWNPLLWWSKKRMVRFSEQACDDWVVAGGQSREDYAQSLLGFKPQKQVAFAPAVVSSKKTLAGRVRRILMDSCTNPRTGAAWAVTASVIAICLAVGIAFAQTRPARSDGTIKARLSRSAAIEQLAAETIIITGRILDPNNEPAYGANIVALPVTSWGYHTEPRRRNKEGYF
ncbi:MAG: M56 family metallopeptidase, partial [Phycisphaerales bacterium]